MAHPIPPTKGPGRGSDHDLGPGSEPNPEQDPDATGDDRPDHPSGVATSCGTETATAPFAWQHESKLLLLEPRPRGWVLAELRFDPAGCHYVEVRRVRYRWTREAAGALLSRAIGAGDAVAVRTARDLQAWLGTVEGGH